MEFITPQCENLCGFTINLRSTNVISTVYPGVSFHCAESPLVTKMNTMHCTGGLTLWFNLKFHQQNNKTSKIGTCEALSCFCCCKAFNMTYEASQLWLPMFLNQEHNTCHPVVILNMSCVTKASFLFFTFFNHHQSSLSGQRDTTLSWSVHPASEIPPKQP